jgi:RNA polymerase sigma-70 factor (ECF subfamily)
MSFKKQPLSDREMIRGIQEEDIRVLRVIAFYFTGKIKGLIWKARTDKELIPQRVKDVYGETLAKVKHNLDTGKYKDQNKFCGYFMKIAKYVNIKIHREMIKEQKRKRRYKDQANLGEPNSHNMDNLPMPTNDYEDDRVDLIKLLIEELPDKDRELFNAFHLGGYKFKELAEIYGKTESAIKTQVCRIRKHLRDRFNDLDN